MVFTAVVARQHCYMLNTVWDAKSGMSPALPLLSSKYRMPCLSQEQLRTNSQQLQDMKKHVERNASSFQKQLDEQSALAVR